MTKYKITSIFLILLIVTFVFAGCTSEMPYEENRVSLEIGFNENLGTVEVEGEEIEPGEEFIFEHGTEVTLEAIPDEGAEFERWNNIDETDKKVTIVVDKDLSVMAEFSASAEVNVAVEHAVEHEDDYLDRLAEDARAEELYVELINEGETNQSITIDIEEFADEYTTGITVEEEAEYHMIVELRGSFVEDDIETSIQSEEPKTFYAGEKEDVEIKPGAGGVEPIGVEIRPQTAESLTVRMTSPDEALEELEELKLEHASCLDRRKAAQDYVGDADYGEVVFEDGETYNEEKFEMMPGSWDLSLIFEYTRVDVEELILLPREERTIVLEVTEKDGEITVTVVIAESPDAPDNLRVEEIDGEYHLVWDWDGEGDAEYTVLRSETEDLEDEYLEPITDETIEDKQYPLEDLEEGYYYWVRAYDDAGRSSELSDSWYYEGGGNQ